MPTHPLILDRYERLELLDQGGQAEIWLGRDAATSARVAIKRLAVDRSQRNFPTELARFERAARLRIGHPNVLDPLASGEHAGDRYIIFPYLAKGDAATLLLREGTLAPGKALRIIVGVAEGLAAAHRLGIVHRDVKPANILLDDNGGGVLIDFGIARILREPTLTHGSGSPGSPPYMAPEQSEEPHAVDGRADQYALGATLRAMLRGVSPAGGAGVGTGRADLDAVLDRLTADEPARRFVSMDEAAAALRSCLNSPATSACCAACGQFASGGRFCTGCGRSFGEPPAALLVRTGLLAPRNLLLPEGTYSVGRGALDPQDPAISRRHFEVQRRGTQLWVRDLGSANGTAVGGRRISTPTDLQPGAELAFGSNTAILSFKEIS